MRTFWEGLGGKGSGDWRWKCHVSTHAPVYKYNLAVRIGMELFWLLEEHRVQVLFILWFIVLALSGLGQGDSLDKVPQGSSGRWPTGKLNDKVAGKCTYQDPLPSAEVKAEMRKRWHLPGIFQAFLSLLLLGSPLRRTSACRSSRPALSKRREGRRFSPPGSSQASLIWAHLGCAPNSGRDSLGKFQNIVDPPYLVPITIKLVLSFSPHV